VHAAGDNRDLAARLKAEKLDRTRPWYFKRNPPQAIPVGHAMSSPDDKLAWLADRELFHTAD
jgi:hypothetical protein